MKINFDKTLWSSIFLANINRLSKKDLDFMTVVINKRKMDKYKLEPSSAFERVATMLNDVAQLTDLIHNCAQHHILENERNNAVLQ